jgi:hypothetical protein
MANTVSVSRFEVRSYGSPDEVRSPNKTRVEVLHLDGFTPTSTPSRLSESRRR